MSPQIHSILKGPVQDFQFKVFPDSLTANLFFIKVLLLLLLKTCL